MHRSNGNSRDITRGTIRAGRAGRASGEIRARGYRNYIGNTAM